MGKRLRLVSRKPNAKTGKKHVSSSFNVTLDVAAAVECGLAQRVGIVQLLPAEAYAEARKLLKHNELSWVETKKTSRPHLATQQLQRTAEQALSEVIGPLYHESFAHCYRALSAKRFIAWLIQELETPGSALNDRLKAAGYDDLVETNRGKRWWQKRLQIRSKYAE